MKKFLCQVSVVLFAATRFSAKDDPGAQAAFLKLAQAAQTPESRAECLARAATALGLQGEHEIDPTTLTEEAI